MSPYPPLTKKNKKVMPVNTGLYAGDEGQKFTCVLEDESFSVLKYYIMSGMRIDRMNHSHQD